LIAVYLLTSTFFLLSTFGTISFRSESGMRWINHDGHTDYCGALCRTDVCEWIRRYHDLQH